MSCTREPLIQAAMAGNQAALLDLLEVARPDIRRYARVACRASDIDDAVQETLWLLYRRVGALRAVSAFSGWLFAIVRRECMRLGRAFGLPTSDADLDLTPLLARDDVELRLELADAIQSLPAHYRVIIVMRDLEERTVDEIGRGLGLTRESVKGRLHRARAMLREYLV